MRALGRFVIAVGTAIVLLVNREAHAATSVNLYVAWMKGSSESNAPEYGKFLDCLVNQSSFTQFWSSGITITIKGIWVVPAPSSALTFSGVSGWLSANTPSVLPAPTGNAVYLVIGDPSEYLNLSGNCGENGPGVVNGVNVNVGRVKTACWGGTSVMRNVTEVGMHELAEAIDGMLGKVRNCGDAPCYGLDCNGNPYCSNITGLSCPGAPASTTTGCGSPVTGWAIQKLSHQGETSGTCPNELTCDFAVQSKPNDAGLSDPCVGTSNGYYCGQSKQWTGGQTDHLYHCVSSATASNVDCPGGCIVEDAGVEDQCGPYDGGALTDGAAPDAQQGDAAAEVGSGAEEDAPPVVESCSCDVAGHGGGAFAGAASLPLAGLFFARRRRRRS